MPISVYALLESDTGALRYVGVTRKSPEQRRSEHIKEAQTAAVGTRRKNTWIRALLARGASVDVELLEETDEENWAAAEVSWIAYLKNDLGLDLVNGNDGGTGNINPSPEVRAIYAETMKKTFTGRPKPWRGAPRELSDESRDRMRQAAKARPPISDEVRENIRRAALERWERQRQRDHESCECHRCQVRRKHPKMLGPKLPKKTNHTRYHVDRGVIKHDCWYCMYGDRKS